MFTKRNVLSQLMRIFDPLGLLTPLTIKGRILFQRAWRKGLYWDQELSLLMMMKSDWLIFRRIYEDTKPVFSPAENLIRLSGALRGAAKEAVTTLLIAANDPDQVIEALQRRFGQSEVIVIQEVAKIKALPKINLSDSGKQVSDFACKVRNCVETIKLLKQREYLFSPELCNAIIGKLPVSMQVQWAHFAFKMNNENFSKLELLSDFLDHFWRRWIKEYLPTLVPRRSASTDHRNLSVGDIVVIVDANLPRGSWPKGRISAVFPGKDGSVRIADVTTEAGTLRRPAKKIIRLPI